LPVLQSFLSSLCARILLQLHQLVVGGIHARSGNSKMEMHMVRFHVPTAIVDRRIDRARSESVHVYV
jgi:hypothetical protein